MILPSISMLFPEERRTVDDALLAYLSRFTEPREHYGAIRYHFGLANTKLEPTTSAPLARGKRLRPIAGMLVGRALDAPQEATRMLMLASELMHGASLIHDDIQDQDELRWGRPTLWRVVGTSYAINAGDALIGMGYQVLLDLVGVGVPENIALRVLREFNEAHLRMCEGQHMDLCYRAGRHVPFASYSDMITRKTAVAFECVVASAAILAGRDDSRVEACKDFGRNLGALYQVCDDVRAIWVEPEQQDKAAGNDVRLKKLTLPLIYGLLQGAPLVRKLFGESSEAPVTLDTMRSIAAELSALGIDQRCREQVLDYKRRALKALAKIKFDTATHQVLAMMVRFCTQAANPKPPEAWDVAVSRVEP